MFLAIGNMRSTHTATFTDDAQYALRETQLSPDNQHMSIGDNIRRLRKERGWTILELATQIESDVGNLSRLERGKQGYSDETLRKLAAALGCTVADLFAGEKEQSNVAPVSMGTRRIPLISYVQAGIMTDIVDPYPVGSASDWLLTDLELGPNAFALTIKGDSMFPDFKEGDAIIVDPAVAPLPGDFVVAKNGENEATFKKYRPRGVNEAGQEVFELVPLNEDYPSMRSDLKPIKIIGTMVEHRRYRRR